MPSKHICLKRNMEKCDKALLKHNRKRNICSNFYSPPIEDKIWADGFRTREIIMKDGENCKRIEKEGDGGWWWGSGGREREKREEGMNES